MVTQPPGEIDPETLRRMPYQKPQPVEMLPDLVVSNAIPTDDRIWVPQSENVWFRPLCLNRSAGYWMNLLKVRKSGVLSRHRHPGPVHALVLKGSWRYLEHDWVATPGSFVYEPPGEVHTLTVDSADEMITFFNISGAMIYVDEAGNPVGYEDVFSKIDMCRAHYRRNGLGESYIEQFVR